MVVRRFSLACALSLTAACGGAEPASNVAVVDASPRSTTVVEVPRVAVSSPGTPTAAPAVSAPAERTREPRNARAAATAASDQAGILVPCDPIATFDCPTLGALGTSSGPTVLGSGGTSGIGLGGAGAFHGPSGGSGTVTLKGPRGNAEITVRNAAPTVGNAERVVAGMRAGFRRCYNRGLAQDPNLAGIVEVDFTVMADGTVPTATSKSGNAALATTMACIRARVQSAQFEVPSDGKPVLIKIAIALSIAP